MFLPNMPPKLTFTHSGTRADAGGEWCAGEHGAWGAGAQAASGVQASMGAWGAGSVCGERPAAVRQPPMVFSAGSRLATTRGEGLPDC